MASLNEEEKAALRAAAAQPPLRQPPPPTLPIADYLRQLGRLSHLPSALKPVRFGGDHWKL